MATTAQATINQSITATVQHTDGNATYLGTPLVSNNLAYTTSQVSKVYYGLRTTTGETLNVLTGLTDGFGNSLTFATVKGIIIKNTHATATMTVGGSTNPLFNALPTIQGGGSISLAVNITTSGSVKNILVATSASLTYEILIIGS